MELPKRKRIRLPVYNYSENGAYFITICSYEHTPIFGEVTVGQGLCSCRLSETGKLIDEEILNLGIRYAPIRIDKYVIMPNHVHLLVRINDTKNQPASIGPDEKREADRQEQSPCPTVRPAASVSDIVCALKSITTKRANKMDGVTGRKIWQIRFHDHVVRNEQDYKEIAEYIDNNPARWEQDRYYAAVCAKNIQL